VSQPADIASCHLGVECRTMPKYKVGDRLQVALSGGRIVKAEVRAVRETTEGIRLQVSFGEETALIYLWQIVEKVR
jgi:hypothetical protein